MKSLKLLLILIMAYGSLFAQDLSVYDLTIEHKKNPLGIDDSQPRFSWKIKSPGFQCYANGISRSGYRQIRDSLHQKPSG